MKEEERETKRICVVLDTNVLVAILISEAICGDTDTDGRNIKREESNMKSI